MNFQEQFYALDVTMRAALVFRYREGLPLNHVALLVDRPLKKLAPQLECAVAQLAGTAEDPAKTIAAELDEMRDNPELTSFSLVSAVRAERNRRRVMRLFA